MRHEQGLALTAGHGMELKPGGDHIMLTGLSSPLKAGERFPMTLHFKRGGDQDVRVVVVPPGAGAPDEY
jgi:copper(I)-binding protein